MSRVHLIGDSHVIMHAELLSPEFNFTHIGACTAYSLMNPESKTKSFYTLKIMYQGGGVQAENDTFIFLFGEIDCRTLIYYKHKKYGIDLSDMIDVVVARYFSAISYCWDMSFNVGIHGIIPAVQQENAYGVEFYGDPATRAYINDEFNKRCSWKALAENIPYFDCSTIPNIRNEQGMVPMDSHLPNDFVHIDPKKVHVAYHFKTWMVESGFLPFH